MARIAGVDLPREKRIEIGLTYIYGIGRPTAAAILEKAGINPDTRVKDLTEDEAGKIRKIIDEEYIVEGDLRREVSLNIKRLMEIGSYLLLNYFFFFLPTVFLGPLRVLALVLVFCPLTGRPLL